MLTDSLEISSTFTKHTVISPFAANTHLYGLTADMEMNPYSYNAFARVLLVDKEGHKYLLAEYYPELTESLKIGETLSLEDYSEETKRLDGITPSTIEVYVRDASLRLETLHYAQQEAMNSFQAYGNARAEALRNAAQRKADLINAYNKAHDKLWRADVTPLSLLPYEDRMRVLGCEDDSQTGGIEYYAGGLFELGSSDDKNAYIQPLPEDTLFVDDFDWRNRHGKNWMTPYKDQKPSSFCVPFSTCGAIEALLNLQYNQLLNYDLSEQEIGSCTICEDVFHKGMYVNMALQYVQDHGVCLEDDYPFYKYGSQPCKSGEITPTENVKIESYQEITAPSFGKKLMETKKSLVKNGPYPVALQLGFKDTTRHAMCLVGYQKLKAGKYYKWLADWKAEEAELEEGDRRIGQTCWIFKNSWGDGLKWPEKGYIYMIIVDSISPIEAYPIKRPQLTINPHNTTTKFCDNDHDGYINWGFSRYPPYLLRYYYPSQEDGDDNDDGVGMMDEYGNLIKNDTNTVHDVLFEESVTVIDFPLGSFNRYVVKKDVTLQITDTLFMRNKSSIWIQDGGKLELKGNGNIVNASIKLDKGGELSVSDGCSIYMRKGESLDVPLGARLNMKRGTIKQAKL